MSGVNRLLVANRGEIARRVFRTCRDLGIGTVAVFSDADADLPFVREADVAVHLPGSAPSETYLRGDLVIAAALATGADAVHPGYGFLSESAAFAQAVLDAGLTWVGPPPAAIEAMGSKLRAKELMTAAGVPCLPTWTAPAEVTGFPVLVKASAGGGGRGMRIVRSVDELEEAFAGASREALSAFGDGTVFLETYVERPRHVEVQVMGDRHGEVVALYERDCSVQRRHQKVLEEAPSPAVTPELREALASAAVAAARAVGYESAGTVEFVLAPDGRFFFLEMNTRLQVEHPVTELVTGLDLVALQVAVARGEHLPAVPGLQGHAIEARLYAEDGAYVPQAGTLTAFDVPSGVRVDAGVEAGSVIGVHYDAMIAKVIAHGATREEASARLADALDRARVHGLVTNRDLLVGVLRSPAWLANDVDTGFLDRFTAPVVGTPREHVVAAALCAAASRTGVFPTGWRNLRSQPQTASYAGVRVDYAHGRSGLEVAVDGEPLEVRVWGCGPSYADLTVGGVRRRYDVALGDVTHVDSSLGHSALVEDERFPVPGSALAAGSLVAPMPGTVIRVAVEVGDEVKAGDVLLVLEAMKMEHGIKADSDGTVGEVLVTSGQQVDAGAVLAVVAALE
ncbi:MAG TPA: biotin carboxylase N-terminal domain-containing protein [Mycobacteriales bacterium]|nr:biotin carboxylase N-terminal domain-containing protein [Mycobacteriales bacterium]